MIKVNGDPLDWREGMTVQDVLDAKQYTFNRIIVWLNDEAVPDPEDYAHTVVPDDSDLKVIHIFAGG